MAQRSARRSVDPRRAPRLPLLALRAHRLQARACGAAQESRSQFRARESAQTKGLLPVSACQPTAQANQASELPPESSPRPSRRRELRRSLPGSHKPLNGGLVPPDGAPSGSGPADSGTGSRVREVPVHLDPAWCIARQPHLHWDRQTPRLSDPDCPAVPACSNIEPCQRSRDALNACRERRNRSRRGSTTGGGRCRNAQSAKPATDCPWRRTRL